MKKTVEDKLRFNNRLTFWSLWGLIVVLVIVQGMYSIDLRNEIDSMPHYECWNETFEGFIDKNQTGGYCLWIVAYGEEDLGVATCLYKGFEANCKYDVCYIDDVKEVCEITKYDAHRDNGE